MLRLVILARCRLLSLSSVLDTHRGLLSSSGCSAVLPQREGVAGRVTLVAELDVAPVEHANGCEYLVQSRVLSTLRFACALPAAWTLGSEPLDCRTHRTSRLSLLLPTTRTSPRPTSRSRLRATRHPRRGSILGTAAPRHHVAPRGTEVSAVLAQSLVIHFSKKYYCTSEVNKLLNHTFQ